MPDLPARFAAIIVAFAALFRYRTCRHAEILLVGAILASGKRTVTSLLRITGLSRERHFVNYHRVLNRARWNSRRAAHQLLELLIDAFVPAGPVILGLNDTIDLTFLTALAPSERYCHEHGKRHKKLTDWARQMVLQARRWLPEQELILVADMGFAARDCWRPCPVVV